MNVSMQAALKIIDETSSGDRLGEVRLQLVSEHISVRELIERRVRHEVETYNAQTEKGWFRGLVEPTDAERDLNGAARPRKRRPLDPDAQVAVALKAFESNGFFMLAEGQQLESLDDILRVSGETAVTFVKLVPLVGG